MEKELLKIEIPDFITKIKTANARKAIYYEKSGKHVPTESKLKHITPLGKCKYEWLSKYIGTRHKIVLCDIKTKEPLVKNSRSAGTPRYLVIKGNTIYAGIGGFINRMIIINGIKNDFRQYFKGNSKIINYPIYLVFTMYDELNLKTTKSKSKSQDLDNRLSIYIKASQDLMKEVGIIIDDDLSYIRKTTYEFIESKKRKLVITGYKYDEKKITNSN